MAGRHALVTGGASGIGLAIARRLSEEGARVAVLDVDGDAAERAAAEIEGIALEADVRDEEGVGEAVRRADEALGGLSIVVNNAGAGHLAPVHRNDAAVVERVLAVNLTGVFHVLRAALPRMRTHGGGVVVNNASASGVRPTFGESPYAAAKAGLIALTSSIAQEYGPEIRANCVSPGVIRTPLTEVLYNVPGAIAQVESATPLGRTGSADEVADVVLFLCSDLSRFVTGQNLVVDGGLGLAQAGIDATLRGLLGGSGD